MSYQNKELAVLHVCSLSELMSHEKEIVHRIGSTRNGGHLLLVDSRRLFKDIRVELTPEAIAETHAAYPALFATTGGEGAYARIAAGSGKGAIRVTIDGLFKKVAS
ncbi:MAG: hypothetical protein ABJE10_11115 [bacterium]